MFKENIPELDMTAEELATALDELIEKKSNLSHAIDELIEKKSNLSHAIIELDTNICFIISLISMKLLERKNKKTCTCEGGCGITTESNVADHNKKILSDLESGKII